MRSTFALPHTIMRHLKMIDAPLQAACFFEPQSGSGSWTRKDGTVIHYDYNADTNLLTIDPPSGKDAHQFQWIDNYGVANLPANSPGTPTLTLDGGEGDDALNANDAGTVLIGGAGKDLIQGGTGDDTAFGDAGMTTTSSNDGDDQIRLRGGNDFVDGGGGRDYIDGGGNDDVIFGGAGDDTLWSGKGNDYLDGEDDNDSIGGNEGNDTNVHHTNDVVFRICQIFHTQSRNKPEWRMAA